ncbi:MAG TPA: 6-phosphogluconolactonase [Verrucomicrobiae bacterium]|nr:6-phosphogluconolactonase [Verrucomicrobiae bacterium]
MSFEIIPFETGAALARTAAQRWLDELAARSDPAAPYCVALSGGRIARELFDETARQATGRSISFTGVHFFWADERCVPPTDPESNFAVANERFFQPSGVPVAQIHRLRGEGPEEPVVREAVKEICAIAPLNAGGQPQLDLIFLGMGEDGHVASLFPGEPEDVAGSPAIYRVVTAVKPPPRRITLGYGAIAAARQVWVLASGPGKEKALRESVSPGGKTPLARVLRLRQDTKIFTELNL